MRLYQDSICTWTHKTVYCAFLPLTTFIYFLFPGGGHEDWCKGNEKGVQGCQTWSDWCMFVIYHYTTYLKYVKTYTAANGVSVKIILESLPWDYILYFAFALFFYKYILSVIQLSKTVTACYNFKQQILRFLSPASVTCSLISTKISGDWRLYYKDNMFLHMCLNAAWWVNLPGLAHSDSVLH